MERIYYFGGKAKDLLPAIEKEMSLSYEEEEIMRDAEQFKHREEALPE